jgi:predicted nucleotidyltransferase component of viral defense system
VVWHNVVSDRFLVRLCQSKYRNNFILKGGTLLAKHLNIGRETKDLDFSIENLERDVETLQKTIEEIIAIDVQDGFVFRNVKVEPLNHFHVNYPGAQIRVDAQFNQNRFSLFIDLGFGDHTQMEDKEILLLANSKGPLFEKDISIACYPMEFVFAEKLETVV